MIYIWMHRKAKNTDPIKWYRCVRISNGRKLIVEASPAMAFMVGWDSDRAFHWCRTRYKFVRTVTTNRYPFMHNPESRRDWDTGTVGIKSAGGTTHTNRDCRSLAAFLANV